MLLAALLFPLFLIFSAFAETEFSTQKSAKVIRVRLDPSVDLNTRILRTSLLDSQSNILLKQIISQDKKGVFRGSYVLNQNPSSNFHLLNFATPKFKQDFVAVSTKANTSFISTTTDDYKLKIISSLHSVSYKRVENLTSDDTGCDCVHGNCACCLVSPIPDFDHSVCVNATYNPQTIGLDLSIGLDGHYFTEEISVRNPPPVCFSVPFPGAEHIAGLCIAFTDLDLNKEAKILSGCIELEVEIIHLRMLHLKIGCFRMPI